MDAALAALTTIGRSPPLFSNALRKKIDAAALVS
jgi:hypothetical protein